MKHFLTLLLLAASTSIFAQTTVEKWGCAELSFTHETSGNPFEVMLEATFTQGNKNLTVSGFYDGGNTYRIRFMPTEEGTWSYTTRSSVRALNRQKGTIEATGTTGTNRGMVTTDGALGFSYTEGERFHPFGTTNYALALFRPAIQEQTLRSLASSGFNKTRLCVLPKDYPTEHDAPTVFPFEMISKSVDEAGKVVYEWDFTRPNVSFFQNLDRRILQLQELGIEADLILFHPYDKGVWGFDRMGEEFDRKYLEYLVSRVAAYRNVWWSLANEWDLVRTKKCEDWATLTRIVVAADPYRHLCSIHGGSAVYYDYHLPEYTHVSFQDEGPLFTMTAAGTMRQIFRKPVIADEIGYEGNTAFRWARWSPQQMLHLVTNGIMGGIYVTHGECYNAPEVEDWVYWSDGSVLRGKSWERIAFLRKIVEEAPEQIRPADISRDEVTSTAGEGYFFVYLGQQLQRDWVFSLPDSNSHFKRIQKGDKFRVEIINLWDMTIEECPTIFEATEKINYRHYDKDHRLVQLPEAPYLLLRIRKVES